MRFSWFLALRYLKPKRTFISIITVISIAGVALGVGVLIVVIAVMSGFEKRIKDEYLRVEPPLYLLDGNRTMFMTRVEEDQSVVPEWRELLPKVKSFPGVVSASPFLDVIAVVQQGDPKKFNDDTVPVDPDTLPPAGSGEDAPDASEERNVKDPAESSTQDGDRPESSADPGISPPDVPEEPAASDTPNAADDPSLHPDDNTAAPEARKPLAQVVIRGVDTSDETQMGKLEQRFAELLQRSTRPSQHRNAKGEFVQIRDAKGEFVISGDNIVLSENLVAQLYRLDEIFPEPGETVYNFFGPKVINEVIAGTQEHNAAKDDPEKKAALEAKDREYPLPDELTLSGIFNDDKQQINGQTGVGHVSLQTAQRLAGAGNAVDGIFVDLADPYDAPAMAEKIFASGMLPEGWRIETWIDRHRQQFEAVANERSMMYIVLGFISLVAAFCIMNTMITMAVQKRREIGMMRALGAKTSHIISLFMTKGFIVGFFGVGIGYALGRLVLHFRNDLRTWINDYFGHEIFDSKIYGLSEIPAQLRGLDELMICGLAFILCTLAAVPPAWMVGRMAPARALRNDR